MRKKVQISEDLALRTIEFWIRLHHTVIQDIFHLGVVFLEEIYKQLLGSH